MPESYTRTRGVISVTMDEKMKRTMVLAVVLGLLVTIGLMSWWLYQRWQTTKVVDLRMGTVSEIRLEDELTVEFASENVKISDFLAEFTGQSLEDKQIETGSLGEQTVTFAYQDAKNRLCHASFVITVIDTVAPTILYDKYTMMVGENDDLIAKIPCGDNADPRPKCELIGDYDPDEAGVYELTVRTKDESGNVGDNPLTLVVVEEYEVSETPPLTLTKMKEQKPGAKIGIDVSRWQEEIDWQAVKADGVEFAILRLGSQKKFDGEPTIDPYFEKNLIGAQAAGLEVGVYFYSLAQTVEEARAQAALVVETLRGQKIELPVVFDWEAWTYWNDLDLSYYTVNQVAEEFLTTVKTSGYQGMLYGSKLPLKKVWWNRHNYPVWLAHYVTETDYDGVYQIWQFSATGEVEGVKGNVDLNVWIR